MTTINPAEAEHFGRLAADWWDPNGSSAMLHRLNPVRLRYLRERIDVHFRAEQNDRRPLAGRRVADVGCGAGLLAEPLARLGAEVTGVDAAGRISKRRGRTRWGRGWRSTIAWAGSRR
jgi:2-polyprenyl-6-hydroxyphenyl methylase/3-demethylubiquinone-9 3-methyltransferase